MGTRRCTSAPFALTRGHGERGGRRGRRRGDADWPETQLQQSARSFEWWATLALQEPPAEEEEGWSAKSMCFPSGLSSCWPARSQGAVTSPLIETRAGLHSVS